MDIALNNYASIGGGSTNTSFSGSFTVNPGEERALYVGIPGGGTIVTAATFHGVALTQLTSNNNDFDNTVWFGLLMPDVGTYTLSVTFSSIYFGFTAVCLNNVDQTALSLGSPDITIVNSSSNANANSWCGDLPATRNMYVLACIYSNTAGAFVYDTANDSLAPPAGPQFSSRTALVSEFTTNLNVSTNYLNLGGFGRVLAGGTFKFTLTNNWSGTAPAHSSSYLFINETLTPPFIGGQMMII